MSSRVEMSSQQKEDQHACRVTGRGFIFELSGFGIKVFTCKTQGTLEDDIYYVVVSNIFGMFFLIWGAGTHFDVHIISLKPPTSLLFGRQTASFATIASWVGGSRSKICLYLFSFANSDSWAVNYCLRITFLEADYCFPTWRMERVPQPDPDGTY